MKLLLVLALVSCLSGCSHAGLAQENDYTNKDKITSAYNQYNYQLRDGTITETEADFTFDFTGTDRLWTITAQEDTEIKCLYEAQITDGKFKMVLITPEKNISSVLEGSSAATVILKLHEGENVVKIVGYQAKGSIDIAFPNERNGVQLAPNKREGFPWD